MLACELLEVGEETVAIDDHDAVPRFEVCRDLAERGPVALRTACGQLHHRAQLELEAPVCVMVDDERVVDRGQMVAILASGIHRVDNDEPGGVGVHDVFL